MDVQLALLSKIVLHGDLTTVVNARITTEFFTDDRYRRVFGYMTKHWADYGVPPDASVMFSAFPTMEWEDDPQPIEYFIDALRERRMKSILTDGLNQAAQHLQSAEPGSVDSMAQAMQDSLIQARLETATSLDIDFASRKEALMERLLDRKENPGHLRGISTGFPGIDYVTGGLQPEQFVVLIGTIKSFKSATLLAMAKAVHEQAKVPLLIGFEMSNVEQEDRLLSLCSGVDLTAIMNGTYGPKDERRIIQAMTKMEAMRSFILSSDIASATTVAGVQAKIQEYTPDVVFIDGGYMMQSSLPGVEPGSAFALTDISRSLKRLAQSSKTPIVITTQASLKTSKNGLSAGSVMYTQAWGQDCDVLLGVERMGERQADESTSTVPVNVKFRVLESRSGPRKEVVLEWDWKHGSVEELDPAVMQQRLDRKTGQPSYISEDGTKGYDDDD
jgi:replicative DNA helicase